MMKAPVALTIPELKALLQAALDAKDERFYLLVLLATTHGLRVSEVIALRRLNFTMASGDIYLTVARLKGSLKTTQKVSRHEDPLFDAYAALSKYIAGMKSGAFLFTNEDGKKLSRFGVNFLMKKFSTLAGLPAHKAFPHALKHSLGVGMRVSGARIEEIKEALGHKSLNSTAQYLRMTQDEVDAARGKAFIVAPATMAAVAGGK